MRQQVRLAVLRDPEAPTRRAQCIGAERPCPWVSCRYHLLVDVTTNGRLWPRFQFDEHDENSIAAAIRSMPDTCALDVADRGPHVLSEIGEKLGTTIEGVRQLESDALRMFRRMKIIEF